MNEEKVYIFTGFQYGKFTADSTGELVPYCNIFCLSKIEGKETNDFRFGGYRAEKFKCVSADVFKDVEPQDKVVLYFNQYGRVTGIKKAE